MRVGAELRLLQGVVVVPVVVVVLVGDLHNTACVPAPLLLLLGDGFAVGPVLVRSLAPMSLHVDAARLLVAHLLREAFAVRDRGEPPGVFRGFGEKTRLLLLLEQPGFLLHTFFGRPSQYVTVGSRRGSSGALGKRHDFFFFLSSP